MFEEDSVERSFQARENRRQRLEEAFDARKQRPVFRDPGFRVNESREWHYRMAYDISTFEYEEMWREQDGCCRICGEYRELDGKKQDRLFVDHDHTTNQLRELLCSACNSLLGYAKDSPDRCAAAKAYLERHNEIATA